MNGRRWKGVGIGIVMLLVLLGITQLQSLKVFAAGVSNNGRQENHFQLTATKGIFYAEPGEGVLLEVVAHGDDLSGVTYQWYRVKQDYGMELIPGATNATYMTENITAQDAFYCIATDRFGNEARTYVSVGVRNCLQVRPATTKTTYQLGEKAVLQVEVDAKHKEGLTYQWSRYRKKYDEYGETREVEPLEDNSDTLITEPVTEAWTYSCTVTDCYKSTYSINFPVYPENVFYVSTEKSRLVYKEADKNLRLKVNVRTGQQTAVRFVWYWGESLIKDGAEDYLDVSEPGEYVCYAIDAYGRSVPSWIQVAVQNHFSLSTDQDVIVVPKGDDAVLKVNASADDESRISYEWYPETYFEDGFGWLRWGGGIWENERSNVLTLDNLEMNAIYSCIAMDGYGSSPYVRFKVYVGQRQELSISSDREITADGRLFASDKEVITLKANATGFGSDAGYLWQEYVTDENGAFIYEWFFTDETTDTLTITANSDGLQHAYYCQVKDGQGRMEQAQISVVVAGSAIRYDANGGTGNMQQERGQNGSLFTLPACSFEAPEGRRFAGWEVNGETYEEGERILLNGDVTVKAVWTGNGLLLPDDDELVIDQKSLTLYDTISIEFKIKEAVIDGKYHDPYLLVTQNGVTERVSKYRTENGHLIFTYRVAPQTMGDVVTAVPHALNANGEDVTGVPMEYSVTEYCYNMLGKEAYQTAEWATFRRLLVDILRYGDAAQIYANYKTDNLASANLTAAQRAMGTDVSTAMTYGNVKEKNYLTVDAANALASIEKAALYLEAAVNVQFKFSTNDLSGLRVVITDDEACTNVIREHAVSAEKIDNNGLYYVNVDALNAGQMRKTIYATVMKGNAKVSNTYRYSIESYVQSMKGKGVPNLDELLDAMMRYGDSAAALYPATK
ncbi:MAG: hypothetical protein K6F51_10385 [Acetatifactor sp.]|nr:hypothetical protein [Acetatifactor sp.]